MPAVDVAVADVAAAVVDADVAAVAADVVAVATKNRELAITARFWQTGSKAGAEFIRPCFVCADTSARFMRIAGLFSKASPGAASVELP